MITGDVVDGAGKPVVGADVVFSAGMDIDGSVPILERATTDESGRFSMAKPVGKRLLGFAAQGVIWARKPGFGLGVIDLDRGDRPSGSFRFKLEPPHLRTLNFRDNDGKPIAGLRVAPRLVRTDRTIFDGVTIPDEWLEAITVTTTVDGTAVILEPERVDQPQYRAGDDSRRRNSLSGAPPFPGKRRRDARPRPPGPTRGNHPERLGFCNLWRKTRACGPGAGCLLLQARLYTEGRSRSGSPVTRSRPTRAVRSKRRSCSWLARPIASS